MKNISRFIMLLFCCNVYAAETSFGDMLARGGYNPQYLSSAADAWASVLNTYGISGEISSYMQDAQTNNLVAFLNTVSALAYNDSALTLYQTTGHISRSFENLMHPMQRATQTKTINIDFDGLVGFQDYSSNKNSDFKTRSYGAAIRARGYITDSWAFGVAYNNTHTETRDNRMPVDGDSNSVTIFSEYIGKSGLFINSGINGGTTRWTSDKTIAGIPDNDAYNTDFYAGQMNMGIRMLRGGLNITPQMGVRYARISSDAHIDAAAQSFHSWWYNTLTGMAGINLGYDFNMGNYFLQPMLTVGGGYDFISNGTEDIRVNVISGNTYNIPLDAPNQASVNAGVELNMRGRTFSGGLNYKLDAREDYIAHVATIKIKFTF